MRSNGLGGCLFSRRCWWRTKYTLGHLRYKTVPACVEEIIFVVAGHLQSTLLLLCCVIIHLVFLVIRRGSTCILVTSLAYGWHTFLTLWRNWWVTPGGITFLLLSFLFWRLLLRLRRFLGLLGKNMLLKFHLQLRRTRGSLRLKLLLELKKLLVDATGTLSTCLLGQSTPLRRGTLAWRERLLKRVRSGRHALRSYLLLFLILLHQKSLVQLFQLVYVIVVAHLHDLGALLKTILRGLCRWILLG